MTDRCYTRRDGIATFYVPCTDRGSTNILNSKASVNWTIFGWRFYYEKGTRGGIRKSTCCESFSRLAVLFVIFIEKKHKNRFYIWARCVCSKVQSLKYKIFKVTNIGISITGCSPHVDFIITTLVFSNASSTLTELLWQGPESRWDTSTTGLPCKKTIMPTLLIYLLINSHQPVKLTKSL